MHIEHNTNKRRLSEWDYSSPGMYFVTFCTYEKKRILGSVRSETMHLSKYGMACKKSNLGKRKLISWVHNREIRNHA